MRRWGGGVGEADHEALSRVLHRRAFSSHDPMRSHDPRPAASGMRSAPTLSASPKQGPHFHLVPGTSCLYFWGSLDLLPKVSHTAFIGSLNWASGVLAPILPLGFPIMLGCLGPFPGSNDRT